MVMLHETHCLIYSILCFLMLQWNLTALIKRQLYQAPYLCSMYCIWCCHSYHFLWPYWLNIIIVHLHWESYGCFLWHFYSHSWVSSLLMCTTGEVYTDIMCINAIGFTLFDSRKNKQTNKQNWISIAIYMYFYFIFFNSALNYTCKMKFCTLMNNHNLISAVSSLKHCFLLK